MKTPLPQARIYAQSKALADMAMGRLPTLNFYDQFDRAIHPDGWDDPVGNAGLWAALHEAETYHLSNLDFSAPKLLALYNAQLVRDSHYSRMGRTALRRQGRRANLKRLIRQQVACSQSFPAVDTTAVRADPASAPAQLIRPKIDSL